MNQKKAKKLRKIAKDLSENQGVNYKFLYKKAKEKYKKLSKNERNI